MGYESGLGEHKQARHGQVGLVRGWNRGIKHLTIGEHKQARQGQVGLVRAWNRVMKQLTI